ncbi:zinc finger BED domain-containing protein RICESLEEPER 2-like [Pistacia vera]|uniref:zinc finger BED domain-containing protein RICESLEEPER 2-like n=1 Tax=Pistacia vera TaxID=55513 RepID=UPI001262AEDA|nr:zinc finger BED domain-containing protein RICESLEEPER 2-like [Pistacia vera]
MEDSIFQIHLAVRYVRSSPARLQKFKECVTKEKIESKAQLVLDVETRWNSTYLMLEVTIKFQKAFELLEIEDSKYSDELSSGERFRGLPTCIDWEYARYFLPFLKVFYDTTLRVSGSLYVTSNAYMQDIFGIGLKISKWCRSVDPGLHIMALRMKGKYDKYWSNIDNINLMLFIVEVLDPRHKLEYVNWVINESFDMVLADRLKAKVKEVLVALFKQYSSFKVVLSAQPSEQTRVAMEIDVDDVDLDNEEFMKAMYQEKQARKKVVNHKTELDKYLTDDCEDDNKSFNILQWWKLNSTKYGALSMIA